MGECRSFVKFSFYVLKSQVSNTSVDQFYYSFGVVCLFVFLFVFCLFFFGGVGFFVVVFLCVFLGGKGLFYLLLLFIIIIILFGGWGVSRPNQFTATCYY